MIGTTPGVIKVPKGSMFIRINQGFQNSVHLLLKFRRRLLGTIWTAKVTINHVRLLNIYMTNLLCGSAFIFPPRSRREKFQIKTEKIQGN